MSGCFTSSRALVSASGSPSRIKKNQVAPVDAVSRSTRLHVTAAFCAPLSFAHVLFEQEDERQAASTGAHNTRCCSIMSRFDNAVAQAQPRSLPLHHALRDVLPDFGSLTVSYFIPILSIILFSV